MYKILRPVDHEAWLQERKKGIGSSEAGTIMGVNHFETPLKLWARKVGLAEPVAESVAMEAGHELEPCVAHWFSSRTGAYILKESEGDWMAVDRDKPYLRVSPDRLFYRDGDDRTMENLCILECKTTSRRIDKEHIPDYWFWQVQYQMGVMGVKAAAVAWISICDRRFEFDWAEVKFNRGCYDALVEKIDEFWNVNIMQRVKPEVVLTNEDAQLMWPGAVKDSVAIADPSAESLVMLYRDADTAKKAAEAQLEQLGLEIRKVIQDNESLVSAQTGEILMTYKEVSRSSFDSAAFKAANPEEYAKWVKTGKNRRLELKCRQRQQAEPTETPTTPRPTTRRSSSSAASLRGIERAV